MPELRFIVELKLFPSTYSYLHSNSSIQLGISSRFNYTSSLSYEIKIFLHLIGTVCLGEKFAILMTIQWMNLVWEET